MALSIAPSMIGRYSSGQSFSLWLTRCRCSLSSRMISGLKYRSTGSPQALISCMITGRLGMAPSFSMLARYRQSIFTFLCYCLCILSCFNCCIFYFYIFFTHSSLSSIYIVSHLIVSVSRMLHKHRLFLIMENIV